MELGPIVRSLLHSKGRFWLIAVEIALTLAVVVNCLTMIQDQRNKMNRYSGMDEENLLVVVSLPHAEQFEDEDYQRASFEQDVQTLRALPGVVAAGAIGSIPLSGSGSSTGRRPVGTEQDERGVPYFVVSPGTVDALGVELVEGRDFVPQDFVREDDDGDGETAVETTDEPVLRNAIVTRAVADVLFPDGDALGKSIENEEGSRIDTIVGIIGVMHGPWPMSSIYDRAMLIPGELNSKRRVRYIVRAEPGMTDSLFRDTENALLGVNDGRVVTVRSLSEIENEEWAELLAVNKMLGAVSLLLVAVTSLGVIGLTSFSVTQRTRQIGTRRALGATRLAILRYFLVENWVLTGIGLALGLVTTYGLNFMLARLADVPMLGTSTVIGAMIFLWIVGLLATLVPALRGTAVSPVVATRTI